MATSRLVRLAPLSGVGFFILTLVAILMEGSDSPDFVAPPAEWATFYTGNEGRVILGSWLGAIGVFFLLWFLGSLAAASRRAEGGDRRASALAHGGGVAGSALLLASYAANMVAALRVDDQKTISPDMAATFGDLANALGFIAAPFAFAVLLGATALVGVRNGLLPAWYSWVTAVIALGLLVVFISWAVMGLFVIWVLVTSILLYVRQPADSGASTNT